MQTIQIPIDLRFPDYDKLSRPEQHAFDLLDNIEFDNLWVDAIRNVCNDHPSVLKFRKLICELKTQSEECPEVMKNILGEEIFEVIVNL